MDELVEDARLLLSLLPQIFKVLPYTERKRDIILLGIIFINIGKSVWLLQTYERTGVGQSNL